ncbi:MAG TPA: hypothetical protein VMU25_00245 [Candidatus Paceibacterota bacterium]|nr:hypothetical protein [Candidatus Paceibacterota bacterium]
MAIRSRDNPTRLLWRRFMLFGLVVFFIFGSWSVWGAWRKDVESAALNQQSQAALADLVQQQSQLQENIQDLQTERGKEAALRQEYGVGKAGEHEIVIVDPSQPVPATSSPTVFDTIKKALWRW